VGKYTSKITALALAGLLLPSLAWAAGLGKLTISSSLGQNLKAEIEIVAVDTSEADSLVARLATVEAYRTANIERTGPLTQIRFAVERRPNGQFVVAMTSVQPINEPFLDMLVELTSATSRLVREYTFLLDPPEYKAPAAAEAVVTPAAEPVAQPAAPPPEPAAASAAAPAAVEAATPAPVAETPLAPAAVPAATYEVKRGDTLAKIANQYRQEGVTLQQMLVALYRGNEEVFDASNMNRLRAGKILNIPEPGAAAGVSQDEARRLIASQGREFAEYRRQIGAAVAQAPARVERGRQAGGQISAPREEKPAPPAAPAKDQLRLAKAEDAKAAGRAGAAARADDLAAKEKALKEANERIALLEKNVQDLQKLSQLKSESGAQLQQAAKAAAAKPGPEPAGKAAAPAAKGAEVAPKAPEPAKAVEPSKAAPAAKAEVPAPSAEPAKAAEAPKAPDAAKPPEPAKAAPKAPAKAPPPPPPPEPGLVDELLDNPMAIGGAGGVVVLLAGYAVYAWRRKRKAQAESSVMGASEPAESPSVFGASGGQQIDTGSASFQSDFSQGGIGKIDTEEIDPLAEADVYMAYGRDAQAEEILKEALGKDSSRQPIRAKLLEIYANRKDLKAFETTATELYAATSGQGPEWDKAVSLGLSIDPRNPLYGGTPAAGAPAADTMAMTQAELAAAATGAAAGAAAQAAPPLDFDLDLDAAQPKLGPQPDIPLDATVTASEATAALDFDLDLGGGGEKAPEPQKAQAAPGGTLGMAGAQSQGAADTGLSIDFDLGSTVGASAAPAPAQAVAPAAASAADSELSIDFDLGSPAEAKPVAEKAPAPDLDLSEISLDLGGATAAAPETGAAGPDAHWQEVATKLDLAKAYQEMGDKDGARELLNEVVSEGDSAQQQQAKTMLQGLG
jgi:pilus assembly protein FimV